MSRLYVLIFLIIASIFSYAGYTVGFRKGQMGLPMNPEAVSESAEKSEIETIVDKVPSETAVKTPTLHKATEAMPSEHENSLRAAQKQITFTDNQDRKLVAEVIEANSQTLKVRRVADNAVVDLPIAMLCKADRAFVAYLTKQSIDTPSAFKPMEDKVWDELFR